MKLLRKYIPILEWGAKHSGTTAVNDLVVALIVSIMLVPQSLAYAQLAGLPPEVGLYASMAPLVVYAIFGTSRSLSVGPVAVTSLMTLAAVAPVALQGSPEYLGAAMALALLTGLILIILGFLKLGFLSNFMSFPVMSGLGTAIGIQIAEHLPARERRLARILNAIAVVVVPDPPANLGQVDVGPVGDASAMIHGQRSRFFFLVLGSA